VKSVPAILSHVEPKKLFLEILEELSNAERTLGLEERQEKAFRPPCLQRGGQGESETVGSRSDAALQGSGCHTVFIHMSPWKTRLYLI